VAAVSFEGEAAVEHAVEDDASGPYVDSSIYFEIFGVGEALWCHVCETAGV
jgi:hypothetical protein